MQPSKVTDERFKLPWGVKVDGRLIAAFAWQPSSCLAN
jgi:hypothetical protein